MSKIIIKNMDYEIYTKKADPIDKEVFNGNHFEENFNKDLAYAKIAVDGRNHGLGFYVCKHKPRNRVMLQTLAVSKKYQRKNELATLNERFFIFGYFSVIFFIYSF